MVNIPEDLVDALRAAASIVVLTGSGLSAHRALAEMGERVTRDGRGFDLLTQNVDRLHQRAGSILPALAAEL